MKDPKQPCRECPFRRESLPGYLGPYDPVYFSMAATNGHEEMPCHLTHGKDENGKSRGTLKTATQCAGRAIFLSNVCKLPENPNVKLLPADRVKIFGNVMEFVEHHSKTKPKKKKTK